jgi:DNA polymerase-4
MAHLSCYWPRAILHVDMNAFFAAVEQRDFPELAGKPVGVTNGNEGTTLITCSYEARAFGVKTGMRIYDARKLCPKLIQRPARPQAYVAVSTALMRALTQITPDVEVFSVDEAFLDVTHCQRLHGEPQVIARATQTLVESVSGGLPCSIGVAGTKLTAKVASDLKKPNGITVIAPWEAREQLENIPLEKICGIGPRISEFLHYHGARTCGDVARLPLAVLARRYGVVGKQLWLACQGRDTGEVVTEVAPPKSVGHGKVLPPRTTSERVVEVYLRHMCEKVAARLRRFELQAGRLYVGLRLAGIAESVGGEYEVPYGLADGKRFFDCARHFLKETWRRQAVTHVQVTATHLRGKSSQLDLFAPADTAEESLNSRARRAAVQDRINARFGEFTVAPSPLLGRSTMPNVIAPAWKPDGLRQHIPDLPGV